jgi:hypothetical protein
MVQKSPVQKSFVAKLEPVPHGGHYVVVPIEVALDAELRHGQRVRGAVNGVPYRSSLMMYGGVFHLGVHKATLAAAGVTARASVTVTIERDAEPLPTDTVPDDLARALARSAKARSAWDALRPSLKREHVKSVLDAKKPETRERRIAKIVAALSEDGTPPGK